MGRPGVVLTSLHVVDSGADIELTPFVIKDGKALKLNRYTARIVARDAGEGPGDPGDRQPAAIPSTAPGCRTTPQRSGRRSTPSAIQASVRQTLDLTISDGIVSSNDRSLRGHAYLQHTAGVNPGNSGGPLLNERGEVVGIVCLSADLNSVSFATPVERIRAIFPSAPATAPIAPTR